MLQLFKYLNIEEEIRSNYLYQSIKDEELLGRCSDILNSQNNFDIVINQATLVLEDRIRKRANLDSSSYGTNLINAAINPDLSKTILKISDDKEVHEGTAHICRGIMQAFRNPTHHRISSYSKEEALKVCAFIDNILQLLDDAEYTK
jgi:uncharacterized protein (TIGR02391 family)